MANINPGTMRPSPVRPPRVNLPVEKVGLVNVGAPIKAQAQPTIQDALNAIQDLSKKITQLSKNQQILETKLDNIQKSLAAVDTNVMTGAQYLGYNIRYVIAILPAAEKSDTAYAPPPLTWA